MKQFPQKIRKLYSLQGKKSKENFKGLKICMVIFDVVREHQPNCTEKEIESYMATWLTQCTLRFNREMKKPTSTGHEETNG
ncbi:unnamed protein product [Callosobruchus maculatus]|uniref:Uncharacterized protein n=1 Tax=Callosobruchus maculatus TaxID=64391 RepID=A0A653CGT3_CALMS|nr:unnamed protein product [Callosobruchus maculatus]